MCVFTFFSCFTVWNIFPLLTSIQTIASQPICPVKLYSMFVQNSLCLKGQISFFLLGNCKRAYLRCLNNIKKSENNVNHQVKLKQECGGWLYTYQARFHSQNNENVQPQKYTGRGLQRRLRHWPFEQKYLTLYKK